LINVESGSYRFAECDPVLLVNTTYGKHLEGLLGRIYNCGMWENNTTVLVYCINRKMHMYSWATDLFCLNRVYLLFKLQTSIDVWRLCFSTFSQIDI